MHDDAKLAGLPRKTLKLAIPVAAMLGAGSAIAIAGSSPGDDGIIHGCIEKVATGPNGQPGSLRVINQAQSCGGSEQAIDWNIQGAPGPQGAKGDKGDPGAAGTPGAPGAPGASGDGESDTPTTAAYLKIDGVTGSSTAAKHPGEIEVLSFSWGTFNSNSGRGGGGGGAGKAKFRAFKVTKHHDRASTALLKASATGKHYKSAVLSIMTLGPNARELIRYNLTDLTVKSFDSDDDTTKGDVEKVVLDPDAIKVTFHQQGANGAITDFTSSFDSSSGKAARISAFSFKTSSP